MLSHHSGARSLTDGEPTEKPARPGAFQISEQVARTGRRKLYAAESRFFDENLLIVQETSVRCPY